MNLSKEEIKSKAMNTLKKKVEIFKRRTDLKDEERFNAILKDICEAEADLIITNNILTWLDLQEKTSEKQEINKNLIIEFCLRKKAADQSVEDFISATMDKATALGIDENETIKILSNNIWPKNDKITFELRRSRSIEDLRFLTKHYADEMKFKKSKEFFCNHCNIPGHSTERCLKKPSTNRHP